MIFLDATSAAASPVNMGVHRTIRGLHAHLATLHPVTPLRWDFRARGYARLSAREEINLHSPFASYREASGIPGEGDWRHWLGAWRDARSRADRRVETREVLCEGNILIIPDLCWDPRIHAWASFRAFPGRKIAIFHDAMPLRIRGQANSHEKLFAEYVRQLAQMDLVICISLEVQADLLGYWKEFGCAPKPTCVIPWPVPFDEARPEPHSNFSARKMIYVSRLKLRKNHLVLLEACEKLWRQGESFSLDLIGVEDAWSDTRKILKRMRQLALRRHPVRWRQHISDAELTQAYRDCSFTVFPSRLEGFGLPIIESLWHGRPVICGGNGAIGEVAVGGGCLQVDQNNADELATAIASLLNNEALYLKLYNEARKRTFRTWDEYGRDLDCALGLDAKSS